MTQSKYVGAVSSMSVPSRSNTAMRSSSGMKSGDPALVTDSTYSTSAVFAGAPSFQRDKGAAGQDSPAHTAAAKTAATTMHVFLMPRIIPFAGGIRPPDSS